MLWIDLRDRYGMTQLILEEGVTAPELMQRARTAGREYVIQARGVVIERVAKNRQMPTGDIEVRVQGFVVLNPAKTPPFLIEFSNGWRGGASHAVSLSGLKASTSPGQPDVSPPGDAACTGVSRSARVCGDRDSFADQIYA